MKIENSDSVKSHWLLRQEKSSQMISISRCLKTMWLWTNKKLGCS